jgi:hypothetical protein
MSEDLTRKRHTNCSNTPNVFAVTEVTTLSTTTTGRLPCWF